MDLLESGLYRNSQTSMRSGFPLCSIITMKYSKTVLILSLAFHSSDCLIHYQLPLVFARQFSDLFLIINELLATCIKLPYLTFNYR